MSRRHVLAGSAAALVTALQRSPGVGAQTASAGPPAAQLVEDLVAANRILADQGVLDGYGHVSARHDRDPARFLMSRSLAP
ncbi:MAG TPA: class II aldolase/adducin family protein, partial [Methylomirabilota bacterium]|nr:class II aldolase/adducin family protein [Methylomirabilota bacterium]